MARKTFYKPKAVMSIHGYLSTGQWQTNLTQVLETNGLKSFEHKYGFTIRFDSGKQSRLVKCFRDWYFKTVNDPVNNLKIDQPYHRPSIVSHSLGSWIVVKAMLRYPEIRFDKIFLHGSIIPRDFDWYSLILNGQVNKIVTEKSLSDWVVRYSFILTRSFHPCSINGFVQKSTYIKYEDVTNFTHSDFQYENRWESQIKKHLEEEPAQLKILHGEDLDMQQIYKFFKETRQIDVDVYGPDYSNDPIPASSTKAWAQIEKNIWSFMVDSYNGKVVGYINTIAVDDESMEKFLQGKLREPDITEAIIKNFSTGGALNLIIMSIAINKATRDKYGGVLSSKPGELLFMTLAHKLMHITNSGKKIKRIASIAWTNQGVNLCKAFGLSKTEVSVSNHPIYSNTLKELKRRTDVHPMCEWWLRKMNAK